MTSHQKAFVAMVGQQVAQENHRILVWRQWVQQIQAFSRGQAVRLSPKQSFVLSELKRRYGASTMEGLLARMDVIPVSLAVAQAIEESGWGRSKAARCHNVFGMRRCGRNRTFSSFSQGVLSYMHMLNHRPTFDPFRRLRAQMRLRGGIVGAELAHGLRGYGSLKGYCAKMARIIRMYGLETLDCDKL